MNIHVYEVSPDVLAQLVKRMKAAPFACCQLAVVAENLGVPKVVKHSRGYGHTDCASRVADRLIQFHRKRGDIVRDGRNWKWRSP